MAKKQHYMTYQERLKLEALLHAKIPVAQIAKQLGFCRASIYNEIKRGQYMHDCGHYEELRYSADRAQGVSKINQNNKGRPMKIGNNLAYANYLESCILEQRYSPAAALAAARKDGYPALICVSTLYSYIDKGVFYRLTNQDLWEKPRRRKKSAPGEKRNPHPLLPSIEDRPAHINDRSEPGHWEMDLVVGKAGSDPVILTMTERMRREEVIRKLPNRKAATVRKELVKLRKQGYEFKSITTDNGKEFLEYDLLTAAMPGTNFYYCHSYASWEKGTVENHNRQFRRWYPKGTDFSKVTKAQLAEVEEWMNTYPRKSLDWKSPAELGARSG